MLCELKSLLFDEFSKSNEPSVKKMNDLFIGEFMCEVQCSSCGLRSPRVEEFQELSLVVDAAFPSVQHSLDHLLRPESLSGDDKYLCSTCKEKVNATRALEW